jgi:hypothetical protein
VDVQADAVAEPMRVAVDDRLAGRLGPLCRPAGGLEGLARGGVHGGAVRTGPDDGVRRRERVTAQAPHLPQRLGRLRTARHERPRHVGPAPRPAVAGEQVHDDRLAGGERALAHLVIRGALWAGRDHRVVEVAITLGVHRLDGGTNLLGRTALAD